MYLLPYLLTTSGNIRLYYNTALDLDIAQYLSAVHVPVRMSASVCVSVSPCLYLCVCRSECGGACLSGDDSTLSSPAAGRHFRARDLDVTSHTPGCHDDACCVAKSLLIHDDVVSNSASTCTTSGVAGRSSSPQARLLYDSRPALVTASSSNIHTVVFSSKPDQQHQIPVTCDCAKVDDENDEPIWRLAQSPSRSGDDDVQYYVTDDVQYYVIDRRKLAGAMRLTASSVSKRTSPGADDVKQLCVRGTRTENSASLAAQSLGECRPLLVLPPGECCRSQRYAPAPVPAGVDNCNDSAS